MFTRRWNPVGEPNGKTALLIHGLASSSLTWTNLARHLTSLGYKVVAPDLSGHGYSAWSESYSVQNWTEDILKLDVKPDLIVGHSIGGLIAANLSNILKGTRTVLIDPVFRLPRFSPLLNGVQFWFSRHMVMSRPKTTSLRHEFVEHGMIRKWDRKSIKALASPHGIARTFLATSSDALMIRAHRSYIFPKFKGLRDGLYYESYWKVGHNIHQLAFDRLTESLGRYLFPLEHESLTTR